MFEGSQQVRRFPARLKEDLREFEIEKKRGGIILGIILSGDSTRRGNELRG